MKCPWRVVCRIAYKRDSLFGEELLVECGVSLEKFPGNKG